MQEFLYPSADFSYKDFASPKRTSNPPMAKTQGHGNPDWTRDETILALDLYFKCNGKMPTGTDVRVRDLSRLLRSLPYHSKSDRKNTFRNPAGVAFKLKNLNNVATGKGLGNVSETDRRVWAELGTRRSEVEELAELIGKAFSLGESLEQLADWDDKEEFFEGRLLTAMHKKRERHPHVRGKLLASRHKRGPLGCDVWLQEHVIRCHV
jgi:5-methylcytosine-specific restriction protein A